ncbi:MAG TPA: PQQ-binding-like beta-propeller repeat protein [Verrucomicrobiae bacterium]|nr:PQQ-binding-like beta-propeller repeat protein [Verrucomicrobiae bacterium]
MRRSHQQFIVMIAVSIFGTAVVSHCWAAGPYHLVKEIAVGGEGGWDDLSIDTAARRLYVTHTTKVVVIDLDKGQVVGEIADTPGVHGFAVAPDLGRGFSSNGREDKVSIVDLKTLQTLSKVDTGKNPDAIVYEPGQQEVYAFNGRGDSATVIDAKTGKVVTTIPLPGKPEFAAVDSKDGRVYCNIEDKSEVAAIDTKTHKVVNTWPVAPGEEPSGIAIDVAHHRVFSGCHNKLMVMSDSAEGKVIASVPIGERVDGGAFDPGTQFAFSSCGDGTVTVVHEDAPGKLTVVQTLMTERGARTMTLDPQTHDIYLPSAKFEPQPTPTPGEPRQRPKIVPGSFKILVYGMENAPKS